MLCSVTGMKLVNAPPGRMSPHRLQNDDHPPSMRTRFESGELVTLQIPTRGVAALAGVFRDDPVLREICNEIYHERDAESCE